MDSVIISLHVTALPLFHFSTPAFNADCLIFSLVAYERGSGIPLYVWIPLYGIIVSSIVGWSIPSIVAWINSKRQLKRLHKYHMYIASLYRDGKLDENDINDLDVLTNKIADAYAEGKITEEYYGSLKSEISVLYHEIFDKKIESLKRLSNGDENREALLENIKEDIADAYSKGKISELHYNLLDEKISNLISKITGRRDND